MNALFLLHLFFDSLYTPIVGQIQSVFWQKDTISMEDVSFQPRKPLYSMILHWKVKVFMSLHIIQKT